MKKLYKQLILAIGEDVNRCGLRKTPQRAAAAMALMTRGYLQSLEEIINHALFPSVNNQLVIVKNIELYSLCEHHLLPFIGKCHVAYMPNQYVLGLSKIARIVDMYARRLQIQEQLTSQIAYAIQNVTSAKGVGVCIEAKHLCMMMCGVEKQHAEMRTSFLLGILNEDPYLREEFFRAF